MYRQYVHVTSSLIHSIISRYCHSYSLMSLFNIIEYVRCSEKWSKTTVCVCVCVRTFDSSLRLNTETSKYPTMFMLYMGSAPNRIDDGQKKNIIIQFSRIFQTPGDHSDNLRAYTRGHWCHSSAIKMLFNRVIRGKYMLYTSFRTRKTSSSMWHNLNSNQQHWP